MNQIVCVNIYLTKDSHGNTSVATCEESCDTVQICGMLNKAGEKQYFESEAYHLRSFCKENDIELRIIDRKEYFDTLWEQATLVS